MVRITITGDGIEMWSLAGKWHVTAHELEVVSASWPRVVIRADGSSFALGWRGLPGRDFDDFVLALRSVQSRTNGW